MQLVTKSGFNVVAAALCTPAYQDAVSGFSSYSLAGVLGAGVALAPSPTGQQIDAIQATASDQATGSGFTYGVRVFCLSAPSLTTLSLALQNLSGLVAGYFLTTGGFTNLLMPDLSTQVIYTPGPSGGVIGNPGYTVRCDVILPVNFNGGSGSSGTTAVLFSARPGGGLVLPANEAAMIVAVPMRYHATANPDTIETYPSVLVSVHGGELTPDQVAHGSAVPSLVVPVTPAQASQAAQGGLSSLPRFTGSVQAGALDPRQP